MSKRRYNSVEFKRVDWQGLQQRIGGSAVVFAVDVAKEDFVASLLDAEQQVLVTLKWRHPQQTAAVVECIGTLGQSCPLAVAMEPSGTYGDALGWLLREAGIGLYRVAPKRVHDAAEVYDGVPSLHDAKAAHLIGRLHMQGVSEPWTEPEPERRQMAALQSRLQVLKQRHQGACNRLEAQLSRHWPESLGIVGPQSVSLRTLIVHYGDPASVHADAQGAAALLRRTGRAGLGEAKVRALVASAGRSLGVPCLSGERELLQWLAGDAEQAYRQLREVERQIEQRVPQTPQVSALAEVVGTITAAVLVAAMGLPQGYPNARSFLKAMGLNLKERSSGKHKGQLKLTKRGPSVVRLYLYFAALRLIGGDPVIQQWYARKTQRPGSVKQKTVIELMRKLAKALWYVAQGERFAPEKMFAQPAAA